MTVDRLIAIRSQGVLLGSVLCTVFVVFIFRKSSVIECESKARYKQLVRFVDEPYRNVSGRSVVPKLVKLEMYRLRRRPFPNKPIIGAKQIDISKHQITVNQVSSLQYKF